MQCSMRSVATDVASSVVCVLGTRFIVQNGRIDSEPLLGTDSLQLNVASPRDETRRCVLLPTDFGHLYVRAQWFCYYYDRCQIARLI